MNLENYHAIDCTEGQEWSEKEKNFFVLCSYTRRKEELEQFFEAITSIRVREMKQSRSSLDQEVV